MPNQSIDSIRTLFQSRLGTLEHLLKLAQNHFGDEELFIQKRIATDMFPFGTQIAFTCNQPHNFALWCNDKAANNLEPEVTSVSQAYQHIGKTKELLLGINVEEEKLSQNTRIELGESLYIKLSGSAYVNEFLIPNFYFHLVTAYNILRMAGVPIGKRDYMMHLVPLVKTE